MDKSYRFLSDKEPTDKQLAGLMKEVLKDVKERAAAAKIKFDLLQKQQIEEAFLKFNEIKQRNGQTKT
jgi:flagellar biosynthesis/type III secretory pathway protein FliH